MKTLLFPALILAVFLDSLFVAPLPHGNGANLAGAEFWILILTGTMPVDIIVATLRNRERCDERGCPRSEKNARRGAGGP